jgi:hypothetical protein
MKPWMPMTAAVLLGLGPAAEAAQACDPVTLVNSWYVRYLGRQAEPCGLNGWVGQLNCGVPPVVVQASILASDEYFQRRGCCPQGIVEGFFLDVLGRPPCVHELNQWVCTLQRVGCRKQLALSFLGTVGRAFAGRPAVVQAVYAANPGYLAPAPFNGNGHGLPPAPNGHAPGYAPPIAPYNGQPPVPNGHAPSNGSVPPGYAPPAYPSGSPASSPYVVPAFRGRSVPALVRGPYR